jgi:hypothetical protein
MYYLQFVVGTAGPIHLLMLFREDNITLDTVNEYMADLTTSMTAVVRIHGKEGKAGYTTGYVWITTTCVRAKCAWISYSVALMIISALFLILVQIESRGVERERLWKSSVLATLFCEADDEIMKQGRPVRKIDMRDIARSTSVSLDADVKTLRLVAR